MILWWSKVTRGEKMVEKKLIFFYKIRPNGTVKWVVEVSTSQVVLSEARYCSSDLSVLF